VERATAIARERNLSFHAGNILSSDAFYQHDPDEWKLWAEYGVLAVEMETNQLYTLAAKYSVEAIALLTVSDSLVSGEALSSEARQTGFHEMMELALAL
ncbi:MAG: purine-nucleoside phosphorylase, partial [Alkalispirochaeta sp.]